MNDVVNALGLHHAFMRHALIAMAALAPACGAAGYLVLVRSQMFATDALSHVAMTGALAGIIAGTGAQWGVVVAAIAFGALLSVISPASKIDDVPLGVAFAVFAGVSAVLIYALASGGGPSNASSAIAVLFGSVFGVDHNRALWSFGAGAFAIATLVLSARRMVFVSVDPEVARAAGVNVSLLNLVFMVAIGLLISQAVQVVGALLVLSLFATPALVAYQATARPLRGMAVAGLLALLVAWGGIALAYLVPVFAPSVAIVALSLVMLVTARVRTLSL